MTTQEAKKISLVDLVYDLGFKPVYACKNGNELWYCSPLRKEKTPSFKITVDKNSWFDFGLDSGGSIIDFVIEYKKIDLYSCFQYLESLSIAPAKIDFEALPSFSHGQAVELRSIKKLNNPALCQYLESRMIDLNIAGKYIEKVYYRRNGKNYFSVGMKNNSNGYEIRTKLFKGCIIPKDITTINKGRNSISVFEGFMDFLSLLTMERIGQLKSDVLILHSTTSAKKAIQYILKMKYQKVYAFLDNDNAGNQAFERMTGSLPVVKDMRYLYKSHKDLNEYLLAVEKVPMSKIGKF